MGFVEQFDRLGHEEANRFLFGKMRRDPASLCAELRRDRPILRFWSLEPGNRDTGSDKSPGFAYLLTSAVDVRHAIEHFTMKTYSRETNRYFLGIDEVQEHERKRDISMKSLRSIDQKKQDAWMHASIEEAWDIQMAKAHNGRLPLNVHEFTRDAVLRFCGHLYGLPREQVVAGDFRTWSGTAFEQFIWKLYGRHFVKQLTSTDVLPYLGKLSADALGAVNPRQPVTFADFLVAHNFNRQDGSKLMSNRDLISNLIGGFQGFIDNAVSCTCITLSHMLECDSPRAYSDFQKAVRDGDMPSVMEQMRNAQMSVPPAPWLPRVGQMEDLPSWKEVCKHHDWQGGEASCILAVGSAHTDDPEGSTALPECERLGSSGDGRYERPQDMRMGHGYHRCVGFDLGDRFVAHVLMRIATLDDVKVKRKLCKKWSWIVKRFSVEGTASNADMATRWAQVPGSDQPIGVCSADGKASLMTIAEFRSIPPEDIRALPDEAVAGLSTRQLHAMTDRQIKALSLSQARALGIRLSEFTRGQLVVLSKGIWGGLSNLLASTDSEPGKIQAAQVVQLIEQLDAEQVWAVLMYRRTHFKGPRKQPLLPQDPLFQLLLRQVSRHGMREQTKGVVHRPHSLSLWSPSDDTARTEDYAAWPGLVDYEWTARQADPAENEYMQNLPSLGTFYSPQNPGAVTQLFQCPPGQDYKKSDRSNVLFSWFAQWVSDSFLRTDPDDRRRNYSNHNIDMCQLYGLTESTTRMLRSFKGGRMLSKMYEDEELLPPLLDERGEVQPKFRSLPYILNGRLQEQLAGTTNASEKRQFLFATALDRGNSSFGYSAITTLFMREHNRLCGELQTRNPTWHDERLFQTARMIVTVMLMKIVVEDYINHIAGPNEPFRRPFKFDNCFAEQENWYRAPRISLEFNLLYRWHSLVPENYQVAGHELSQKQFLMNNEPLVQHGLGKVLNDGGLMPANRPGLFNTVPDLLAAEYAALKMGRTYKVGSFNHYRKAFGLPEVTDFRDISENPATIEALQRMYQTPGNVEFLVGLYAEDQYPGRVFGRLMTKMLGYDAFTQTLSNPLLSKNVYTEKTFTCYGLDQIAQTPSLASLWQRNGGDTMPRYTVTFDL